MVDLIVNTSIAHSLLLVGPVVCAGLLRLARCPGSAVVGGAVAGILLGPTIMGRVMPEMFEHRFVGGVEQREARDILLRRQQADRLAAEVGGLATAGFAELADRHRRELAEARDRLADARWHFQRPFRTFTASVAVLCLLGTGTVGLTRATAGPRAGPALSIGLWAALLPGSLTVLAMIWWWRHPPAAAALAAVAVAVGPCLLTRHDVDTADEAEPGGARLVELAGRVATAAAIPGAAWAMLVARGAGGLVWVLPLLALPAGWLLPRSPRPEITRAVLDLGLVPVLAACVALKIELYVHAALAPLIVLAIISGDGRWLGALVGALLPGGRRAPAAMRLVLPSMACGPTQLAVTAVAVHVGVVPEAVALGLLLGAATIEVTAPARRSMARALTPL